MLNENKKKPPKPKKYFFGENYIKYLSNLATFELICGIIMGIYTFTCADSIVDLNSFASYFRNLYIAVSVAIIISSIIIYILIIAICHILDNSIENRKLLLKLINSNKNETKDN